MKKASKVFHIFAGIVGILMIPGLIFISFAGLIVLLVGLFFLLALASAVFLQWQAFGEIGMFIETSEQVAEYTSVGAGLTLGGLFTFTVAAFSLIVVFTGIIFAFIGAGKKKRIVVNVFNIVLGIFGLAPFLTFGAPALAVFVLFIIGIFAVILMLWNPSLWIVLAVLFAVLGSTLFFLFSVLGGIFGLVQKKDK